MKYECTYMERQSRKSYVAAKRETKRKNQKRIPRREEKIGKTQSFSKLTRVLSLGIRLGQNRIAARRNRAKNREYKKKPRKYKKKRNKINKNNTSRVSASDTGSPEARSGEMPSYSSRAGKPLGTGSGGESFAKRRGKQT